MAEFKDEALTAISNFFQYDVWPVMEIFWIWLADLYDKPLDTPTLVAINSIGVVLFLYASDRINNLTDDIFVDSWPDGTTYADPQITGFARAMSFIQGAGMLNFIALILILFDRPDPVCQVGCGLGSVEITPLRQLATAFTMISGVVGVWGAVILRSSRSGSNLQTTRHDSDAGEVFSMPPEIDDDEPPT